MSPESKALAISAIEQLRGDDLHRAQMQFAGYLDREMDEQHGQSGKTRRQILAEYEAHDAACTKAISEIRALP